MPNTAIVDQFGRPYQYRILEKEVAKATTVGVRPATFEAVSNGLTPAELASILQGAAEGDIENYLTLANEMEERDLHYLGVLSTRKLSVAGAPLQIHAFDDSDYAKEIANSFSQQVMETPEFRGLLFDLLDALGKSFSVVEPIWDTSTTPWTYKKFKWTDQRWFHFDRVAHTELRLKSLTNHDGDPLPGGAFVAHFPKIRSGIPIRVGLARAVAIAYMAKNYTLKDWLAFMEVFGMPIRIGKYDQHTIKETDRTTLRTALANIGHDAAAMIPRGMDIEIIDVKRGSGSDALFGGLADYLDKQVSKGVLGQTMTTDDGSSLAQAKEHGEVKQDIREADARDLTATIQRGIVRPWVQINFGENAPVPRFEIDVSVPEDLKLFTEAVLPWVEKGGLTVGATFLRDKFGIPDPYEAGEEEIIGVKATPEPTPNPDEEDALNAQRLSSVSLKDVVSAERIAADGVSQWERVMSPHKQALIALARRCNNYDEFLAGLELVAENMDSDPFVQLLAEQTSKARGIARGSN